MPPAAAAHITATDLNPAMVTWGQQHVPDAHWQQADAQDLGLADGCADVVVCQFGIMFFPDKRQAFAEAARVLTPGGTLLFTSWDVVDASAFPAALVESVNRVLPDDPPTFVVRVPHGYTDHERIRADLAAAGLEPLALERVTLPGHASSARSLAEGFCRGTPLRFALEQRGDLAILTETVAREMTAILGAGPVTGNLTAILIRARKLPTEEPGTSTT